MSLDDSALEYISGSGWTDPIEAARELTNLAKRGCAWPKATMSQWVATFDKLVTEGKLQRRGDGLIYIAVEQSAPVQLGLF